MSTTMIRIQDGRIYSLNYSHPFGLSDDGKSFSMNDWTVTIKDSHNGRPGRIVCHAEREYADGPAICHREFKLADGIVGLAGGNICDRYAYFRSNEFQDFLNKHGITAVKHEDPNQKFSGFVSWSGRGEATITVESDGEVDHDFESNYSEGVELATGYSHFTVSGATWAIVTVNNFYGDNRNYARILYSNVRNVTTLDSVLPIK